MFTLFRCFTEACETYDGDPLPEQLFQRRRRAVIRNFFGSSLSSAPTGKGAFLFCGAPREAPRRNQNGGKVIWKDLT